MIIKMGINSEDVLKYKGDFVPDMIPFIIVDGFYLWELNKLHSIVGHKNSEFVINGVTCGMSSRTPKEILKVVDKEFPSSVDLYELIVSEIK